MEKETQTTLSGNLINFVGPSGKAYVIREQNGEDEEILSNPGDAKNMMNFSNFIAGIVVKTDATTSGKLTPEEAHSLPSLDRYAILIKSRIHSLGESFDIKFDWGGNTGPIEYEVELEDLIHDYSKVLEPGELLAKPHAVPQYQHNLGIKDIQFSIGSGKQFLIDLQSGESEALFLSVPENSRTKNLELVVRNLRLIKDGEPVKVTNFKMFSAREMGDIRKFVRATDPVYSGDIEVENPNDGSKALCNILGSPGFFYLGEI